MFGKIFDDPRGAYENFVKQGLIAPLKFVE